MCAILVGSAAIQFWIETKLSLLQPILAIIENVWSELWINQLIPIKRTARITYFVHETDFIICILDIVVTSTVSMRKKIVHILNDIEHGECWMDSIQLNCPICDEIWFCKKGNQNESNEWSKINSS